MDFLKNKTMKVRKAIEESIKVKTDILSNDKILDTINLVSVKIAESLKNGGKVLFCGNGGSAADAQHLAAELSGRFYYDRNPLPAEALHVNTSYLTAVANDYSYDVVYSRLIKGMGKRNDVLICLSTSGNSKNILLAIEEAQKIGMLVVGLTGVTGGKMKDLCHHLINVPSTDTPRIQESHIMIGHIICEIVESKIFPK